MHMFRNGESLQIDLAGAHSTAAGQVVGSYCDNPGSGRESHQPFEAASDGTTAVEVFAGQRSGRALKTFSYHNADNAAQTLTVQKTTAAGNTRIIWKGALAAGETLHYSGDRGWYVTDSVGSQKTTTGTENSTAQSSATSAGLADSISRSAVTSAGLADSVSRSAATSAGLADSVTRSIAIS